MRGDKILVVDDKPDTCWIISEILKNDGYAVRFANDGESAMKEFVKYPPDLVLLDMRLPDIDGLSLLEKMKGLERLMSVIMISAYSDVKKAVKAMKLGAFDYVTKPFNNEELAHLVKKALREDPGGNDPLLRLDRVKGSSPPMRRVFEQIEMIAPTNMTVVLQGESGAGKEVIARMIHLKSRRKDGPFIAIDCGAMPETLVESELFGYEKGAFTGAGERKEGLFELASGGTLFLDETTNIANSVQAKLLRAIQERSVRRLGGKKDIDIDVRIVVATNSDFNELVRLGRFRSDLYFRLNEFAINVPPLRERTEDILPLAELFIEEANVELGKNVKGLSEEAMEVLKGYDWPGNIREMRNLVRRAVLAASSDYISPRDLPEGLVRASVSRDRADGAGSLRELTKKATKNVEKTIITEALARANNNKTRAAKLLKIDRVTLYAKMKALGLE
ncbi:MAG: sigma-54-dependent Fis family transcriptional regulator [Deltaproteobacteria bacterium]|nr:sigma-54-dependent Fis family transcriptional regulator [Deltaproteobacteria bacterium]